MAILPDKRIQELANKWLKGSLTQTEQNEFDEWFHQHIDETYEVPADLGDSPEAQRERLFAQIEARVNRPASTYRLWPRIAAAASIILCLSAGGYFLLNKQKPQQTVQNQSHDVLPGTNHALLKIGGGRTVVLDHISEGFIARKGGTAINKTGIGSIAYSGTVSSGEAVYDTLVVPAGAKPYNLTLADGSKLLVNVASMVRYPENFSQQGRRIDLISGEAFFEVNHDPKKPLKIFVKGQIVEDLGTEFNIKAYDDDAVIKTTLTRGSLSITKGRQTATLIPGEQAITSNNSSIRVVKEINIDEELAWKEGMFQFDTTPLEEIMRQVSRWYDVKVTYQDETLKRKTFFAVSTRFAKVSQLLHNLEQIGGVKFKIEGKTIMVLNSK